MVPVSAYWRPASFTCCSRGTVTTAASGALNMGLSGTVRIVWSQGKRSLNCATAGSKFCRLLGKPQPEIITYLRWE